MSVEFFEEYVNEVQEVLPGQINPQILLHKFVLEDLPDTQGVDIRKDFQDAVHVGPGELHDIVDIHRADRLRQLAAQVRHNIVWKLHARIVPARHHDPEDVHNLILEQAWVVKRKRCKGYFEVWDVELLRDLAEVHVLEGKAEDYRRVLGQLERKTPISKILDLLQVKLLDFSVRSLS